LTRFPLSREAITAAVAVCLALTSVPLAAQTLANQATDPAVLKQVIIFGRHGVRSAAVPASTLAVFTSRPYPDFGVPTGYLTVNGAKNEVLLELLSHLPDCRRPFDERQFRGRAKSLLPRQLDPTLQH
jgi:hypothetical protein